MSRKHKIYFENSVLNMPVSDLPDWFGTESPAAFRRKHQTPEEFELGDYPRRTGGKKPRGGRSRGSGGRHFFERGNVKFVLLGLLLERPMHGYEMIKALEVASGGAYVPSAGTIYPMLQLLEDQGWVTCSHMSGKKVYQITEQGQQQLVEYQLTKQAEQPADQATNPNPPLEPQAVREAIQDLLYLLKMVNRQSLDNAEQQAQLLQLIAQTRLAVTALLNPLE